jgi:hypothetical protein
MTPKEKAKELVIKMYSLDAFMTINMAKDSALICVDEILSINSVDKDYDLSNYWEEVKKEIKLL